MTHAPSEELVLLTSYFNLAGGRRQDTADTFKVESSVPSGTSPDGVAALYVVTEASAGGHMGPRARRLVAETIGWECEQAADAAPPQRLRGALRAAHVAVADEGDGHVAVGAGVIVVEAGSIFLAQASPAQVYVLHEGQLHSITTVEEPSPFARALGALEGPHISLFRDEISTGDVLALVSSWYARGADPEDVRECFSAGTAEDIAEALLDLARAADVRDVTGIIIEAVDASMVERDGSDEEIPGFMEQVDAAVAGLAGVGRMLWTELRTTPRDDVEPQTERVVAADVDGDEVPDARPLPPRQRRGLTPSPDATIDGSETIDDTVEAEPPVTRSRGRRGFLTNLRFPSRGNAEPVADEDEFDPLAPGQFPEEDEPWPSARPSTYAERARQSPSRETHRDPIEPIRSSEPSSRPRTRTEERTPVNDPYEVYREQATDEIPVVPSEAEPAYPADNAPALEEPRHVSAPDEPSYADAEQGRPAWNDGATAEIELPTQNTAEIPVINPSSEPYTEPPVARPASRPVARPVQQSDVRADEQASAALDETEDPSAEPRRRRLFSRENRVRRSPIRPAATEPDEIAAPEPAVSAEMEEVNARLHAGPDMGEVVPPVQAFPDTSTEPSRIYATSKDIQAANKRPRRFGGVNRPSAIDPLSGPAVIRPGVDLDLRRPSSRSAPPAAIWATGVLFFALLAVAGYLWWQHRHTTAAVNPYPALVRTDIRKANGAKDPTTQDRWLARARTNLALARKNGDTQLELTHLAAALGTTADTLHHVTHVTNQVVLTDFTKFPGARPTQIAVSPGVVFVMDIGRKGVFAVHPTTKTNPTELVSDGQSLDGYTIGAPQQVATDGQTALVLDTNNVVVRDLNGVQSATSLTPGAPSVHYVQMGSSDPDIYLLDPSNSQVWRYPYGVADYNPPPATYFDTTKPDLSTAVSFVYDGLSLYVLKRDGTVMKWDNQANPVRFTAHTLTPVTNPTEIYTDQGLKYLWIADPTHHRIVQIDKNGGYVHTYASPAFSSIKSMAVGPAGNTVFLLSGSRLLSFNLAP
jgi:hypothetical protein